MSLKRTLREIELHNFIRNSREIEVNLMRRILFEAETQTVVANESDTPNKLSKELLFYLLLEVFCPAFFSLKEKRISEIGPVAFTVL